MNLCIFIESLHLNHHVQEETNGPRYCPSIESKMIKFPHKSTHYCWVEPEGWSSEDIYLQVSLHEAAYANGLNFWFVLL